MGGSQYCNFCFPDFFAVSILHFMIPGHKHPTILVTESDDLRVFYILPYAAVFISEPFRKPLNGESRSP